MRWVTMDETTLHPGQFIRSFSTWGIIIFCLFTHSLMYSQSLSFNQVLVISSADGVQTVPSGKCWKIENINGGSGQITVNGAASGHCGGTCSGGVCSSSSCKYVGYIWELNATPIDAVEGCYVCSGSACTSGTTNCPPTFSFAVNTLPATRVPFWMKAGNTLRVNASNVWFSIIEFNIVP